LRPLADSLAKPVGWLVGKEVRQMDELTRRERRRCRRRYDNRRARRRCLRRERND
jgi:hypothetical protein